jgi:hypothetical protein
VLAFARIIAASLSTAGDDWVRQTKDAWNAQQHWHRTFTYDVLIFNPRKNVSYRFGRQHFTIGPAKSCWHESRLKATNASGRHGRTLKWPAYAVRSHSLPSTCAQSRFRAWSSNQISASMGAAQSSSIALDVNRTTHVLMVRRPTWLTSVWKNVQVGRADRWKIENHAFQ